MLDANVNKNKTFFCRRLRISVIVCSSDFSSFQLLTRKKTEEKGNSLRFDWCSSSAVGTSREEKRPATNSAPWM
ncbi:Hypothetical protein NTJ_02292 [Nesidiocoris tenuis]|uniref:Uncharacterized protein n=1 Tax=Nesidiocoris tenuis TaxID=355587 RepID=A0ABN7AB04_9HEMI|nr:Hypothetical protein NTJ_02292 [Nesidiocoris tenuis]